MTSFPESGTIDEKVNTFKELISQKQIKLKAKTFKQREHTLGTKEWLKRVKRDIKDHKTPASMLFASEDVSALINKYCGTGEIVFRDVKQVYPVEFVTADHVVGKVWNSGLGRYVNTSRFEIRYSSDGFHIHPVKEKR